MFLINVEIDTRFGEDLTKRVHAAIMKKVHYRLGAYWLHEIRPRHFTKQAPQIYGYAPRQGEGPRSKEKKSFFASYLGRKQKTKRHQRPLVFSGTSERLSAQGEVRPTSKRVRVVMRVPAFNFVQTRRGYTINMREELTRVTQSERNQLGRVAADIYRDELNRHRETVRETV